MAKWGYADGPLHASDASFAGTIIPAYARARMEAGLIGWLCRNMNAFDVPQENEILDVEPEDIVPCDKRKAFAELGLALRLFLRGLSDPLVLEPLKAQWLAIARKRQVFFDARRRYQLLPFRIINYATLVAFDSPDEQLRASLQKAFSMAGADRIELASWLKVGLWHHAAEAALDHHFPSAKILAKQSSLFRPPSPTSATHADLYAFTHLVFGLTSFGRESPGSFASSAQLSALSDYSEVALAKCLAEKHWDLVAEMLISRIYLQCRSEFDFEAAAALCASQDSSGYIPEPVEQDKDLAKTSFERHYHPSLVSLILLSAERQRVSVYG